MKRILLLNPPWPWPILRDYYCSSVSKAAYLWQPIDLLAQSGWLAAEGHEVRLLDAIESRLGRDACLAEVERFRPDLVLMLSSPLSAAEDDALVERLPAVPVIVSGEEAFGDPGGYLARHPRVEGVLADFTSPALARYLRGSREGLESFWWRENGEVRCGPPAAGRFALPVPLHSQAISRRYRMPMLGGQPFATLLTDFGCPHRCTYCNSGSRGHRLRDPSNLPDELDVIEGLGIRHLLLKDMCFGADRQHALEITRILHGRNLTWHAYARPESLDPELVGRMAGAGCMLVQMGVESGDTDLRRRYGKGTTQDQILDAVERCRRAGIRVGFHFVLGLPGEDRASIRRTSRFIAQARPDYVSLNVAVSRQGSAASARPGREGALPRFDRRLLLARNLLYLRYYLSPSWLALALSRVSSGKGFVDLVRSGLGLLGTLLRSHRRERDWIDRLRAK